MGKNPWFDKWAQKAKQKGYPARSVFKLEDIQQKFRLIKKGMFVLDLGSAPGSWSKYACRLVGKEGKVVGVDLQDVKVNAENFFFLKKDAFELDSEDFKKLGVEKFDVILSDMAPKTTGEAFVDHMRSVKLVYQALNIAKKHLKSGGHFVAKIFDGSKLSEVKKDIAKEFKSVKLFKPKALRKGSKETFIIAMHKK